MSKKHSAGLLLFRERRGTVEVLLVHPGGPFWVNRDDGAWSIPKGEVQEGEEVLAAAKREFSEETGTVPPVGDLVPLQSVRQPSGKVVHAWASSGEFDVAGLKSNVFTMEWPPKSGEQREYPEVDQAAWFPIALAREKILKGQLPFLSRLETYLAQRRSEGADAAQVDPET